MGCDGGTIPRRDELVKTKKKPESKDKTAERLYRWRHCAVSQTRLQSPIVACELGRLYNKDEVITRLLNHARGDVIAHVRGLKDMKELQLTPNPSFERGKAEKGDLLIEDHRSEFVCPITAIEMNGKSRFCFIWTCGCVLSERAMKEIKSETCHKCNRPFVQDDVIPLNPPENEITSVQLALGRRREKAKMEKKLKKEGKRAVATEQSASSSDEVGKKKKMRKNDEKSIKATMLVNGMASNVLQDEDFKKIRAANYSVASDPSTSEVFKSLFDTHKTAQNKTTAHWVTCNPQYF